MALRSLIVGAAALLFPVAAPALAHAGFLLPILNDADGTGDVIIEASFSDVFPVSEFPLVSDNWAMIGPDGTSQQLDPIAETDSRTLLQVTLQAPGIYRFTTGERLGRTGEIAFMDGNYIRIGSDGVPREDLPEGADILSSQTATVSDLYLRRGAGGGFSPTRIGRLAITPLTDPTRITPGDTLTLEVTFDGAPLANQPLSVFATSSAPEGIEHATGEDGRFSLPITPNESALVLVRHIAPAPRGADTDLRSYSSTLTISAP